MTLTEQSRIVCAVALTVAAIASTSPERALAQAPGPVPTPTPRTVELPAAHHSGGPPLMEVLAQPVAPLDLGGGRLSMQHLANMLWAGSGMGRAQAAGETPVPTPAPSGFRPIEIFVLLRAGAFRYEVDAASHRLRQVVEQDIRGLSGPEDPAWRAPVTLVYVTSADPKSRLSNIDRDLNAAVNAGTVTQIVSLYCASEGLAAAERPLTNRRALARRLRLRADQRVVAAQAIGPRQ